VTIVVVTAFVVVMGVALAATSTTAFCGLCHNMKASVTAYRHSAHRGVNCEQCHSQPGPFFFLTAKLEALQEPVKQVTGKYEKPILGTVVNASCRRCHTNAKLFPTISKNGVNVNHKHLIEAGYQCTTCHSTVAHLNAVPPGSQTRPAMDKCLVCHNNNYRAADGTVAVSRCDLCHVEPASGAVPASHRDGALWLKIHGTNGILSTCSACHPQPGRPVPAGVPGTPPNCVGCHGGVLMPHPAGWLKLHGAQEQKVGRKACDLCHDGPAYCDGCHQVKLPHPADWLNLHAKEAAASSTSCLNCHSQANCQACHAAHQSGTPRAHRFLTGGVPAWTASPTTSPSASATAGH
jgi:cytochrome c-type protein NapC